MIENKIVVTALRYVLDMLDEVNHYPYHNINHTLDLYSRCDYLADKEFIYLEDKTDLLLAALFHDTGFTIRYRNNEILGAEIAEKYLQSIGWREDRIETIKGIIMATVVGSKPKNKLEQIIQDADFDNLGRKDCLIKTMLLKKELKIINKTNIPTHEWLLSTHGLFRMHKFHTYTAKAERDKTKQENIRRLEKRIEIVK